MRNRPKAITDPTDCAFSLGSGSFGVKPAHSGFGAALAGDRARPLPPAVTIVTSMIADRDLVARLRQHVAARARAP